MPRYHIRARSVIHPGNLLVQDADGRFRIYFANTNELSATAIESTLAEAMLQCYEWHQVNESIDALELHIGRSTEDIMNGAPQL